jgi:hypothetical protein
MYVGKFCLFHLYFDIGFLYITVRYYRILVNIFYVQHLHTCIVVKLMQSAFRKRESAPMASACVSTQIFTMIHLTTVQLSFF